MFENQFAWEVYIRIANEFRIREGLLPLDPNQIKFIEGRLDQVLKENTENLDILLVGVAALSCRWNCSKEIFEVTRKKRVYRLKKFEVVRGLKKIKRVTPKMAGYIIKVIDPMGKLI